MLFRYKIMIKIEIWFWQVKSRASRNQIRLVKSTYLFISMEMLLRDKTMIKIEIMVWRLNSRVFEKTLCLVETLYLLAQRKWRFVKKQWSTPTWCVDHVNTYGSTNLSDSPWNPRNSMDSLEVHRLHAEVSMVKKQQVNSTKWNGSVITA